MKNGLKPKDFSYLRHGSHGLDGLHHLHIHNRPLLAVGHLILTVQTVKFD